MTDLRTDAEIEIAKFWCNRRGEAVIVKLVQYHGRWCCDLRRHYTNQQGMFAPTNKGLMLDLRKLPELVKAVERAEKQAQAHGLLDGGDE